MSPRSGSPTLRRIQSFALATALAAGCAAASAQPLPALLDKALRDNPEVRAAVDRRLAAEAETRAARAGWLPRIDLDASYGRQRLDTFQSRLQGLSGVNVTDRGAGLVLSQMLYDGAATRSEVDRAGARLTSAEWTALATAEDIALRTATAYLDVLRSRATVQVARDNLDAHARIHAQIRQRTEGGVGRRADLDQADGRLALAASNLRVEEQSLAGAELALRRLVGAAPGPLQRPAGPQQPWGADDAPLYAAAAEHPLLRAGRASVDAAQADIRAARASLQPRLSFELGTVQDRNAVIDLSREDRAMLVLRWNLFRGFGDQARVSQAGWLAEETREQLTRTQRQLDETLGLALSAWRTAADRNPILNRYVQSTDATRGAYASQFAIGQRTLLDLLNAENEHFNARLAQITGDYAQQSAAYRVHAAIGSLLPVLGVTAPRDAPVSASAR